ncbi:MAG: hypothetical protein M0R70_05730 [Nitrospirae bacterium]|nr:hypothetical protein [Nitrospirota bacterium]
MKLSNYNRLCAISRCDDYVRDLKTLLDLLDKIKPDDFNLRDKYVAQLCEKWNLKDYIVPLLLKGDKQYFTENYQEPIVEVNKYAGVNNALNAFNCYDIDFNVQSKHLIKHIQIDMTSSRKDLLKDFARKIDNWSKQYLKDAAQDRQKKKTEYDPWEVYDLYRSSANYSEVARRISGLSGNATYNVKLKECRKKVINAHKRALEMIEAVKPTYRKPLFR